MQSGRTISDHDLYCAVEEYVRERGISPTLRELAEVLGVVPSTVREHLRSLRKKGMVTFDDRSPRTVRIVACPIKPSSEAGAA